MNIYKVIASSLLIRAQLFAYGSGDSGGLAGRTRRGLYGRLSPRAMSIDTITRCCTVFSGGGGAKYLNKIDSKNVTTKYKRVSFQSVLVDMTKKREPEYIDMCVSLFHSDCTAEGGHFRHSDQWRR